MANDKTEIILMVAENFGVQATERIIFLWLNLLDEYPLEVCQKAALNLIRNTGNSNVAFNTMPPFSVMQRELDAISGSFTVGNLDARAESAWDRLMRAVETFGAYQSPTGLDDTLLYCVRSLGGWNVICNWRESDLNWRKKEFIDLYRLADGKVEMLEAGPQAIGLCSSGTPSISASDTKKALADFMDSIKPQGLPQ